MERFRTFEEFWPYYLGEHSLPTCRALHYFGTSLAVLSLVAFVATAHYRLIPISLVFGYGPAWIGHFFVEKNRPATFTYPSWSLFADFKMLWCFVTGRIDGELAKVKTPPAVASAA